MTQYLRVSVRRPTLFSEDIRLSSNTKLSTLLLDSQSLNDLKEDDEEDDDKEDDASKDIFNLNIGGTIFQAQRKTLNNIPDTKLANLTKEDRHYNKAKDEYFFDRNPSMFNSILDCYRCGEIHIHKEICAFQMRNELIYWGLSDEKMGKCCQKFYLDSLDEISTQEILLQEFQELPHKIYAVVSKDSDVNQSLMDKIWIFLDNPRSSRAAQIWSAIYLFLTITTILTFFVETHASCRVKIDNDPEANIGLAVNTSETKLYSAKINFLRTTRPLQFLYVYDVFCIVYFTVEFILRFIVCPRRLRLLKSVMCVIDLLYLLPLWIIHIAEWIDPAFWQYSSNIIGLLVLQTFKIFRILRIVRFCRYYRGLKILWLALKASIRELFLLVVFVGFAVTIYASLIYSTELYHDNNVDNAFTGLWWAVITMTTVGYGDVYPDSGLGYLVASFCAVTGIILIGLPVPIIASNFHAYYGLRFPEETHQVKPKPKRPKHQIRPTTN